jgi:putative restriction endonuclease
VTIDRDHRFVVSERVKTDFNNGNEYRRLHGARLTIPADPRFAPSRDAIDWHNRERFLG